MSSKGKEPSPKAFPSAQAEFEHLLSQESIFKKAFLYVSMALLFPPLEMVYFYGLFIYLFYVASPLYRSLLALYWINMFFNLDSYPSTHGYSTPWLRKFCRGLPFWYWVRSYFDSELVKTADLDPTKPHLLLYHPHGIISMGLQASLALSSCSFEEKYPGVRRSVATLVASFKIPFFREWILMNGFISCGRKTLLTHLRAGKSVVLVPGGAQEALHTNPGTFKLHLLRRKGFVRVALASGCSLVPCLGFGENEMFKCVDNQSDSAFAQMLWKGQVYLMKKFTFSFPILTHVMPKRVKVAVVVGKPLEVPKVEDPTDEVVEKYHKLYVEALRKLYEEHKEYYGNGVELEIV